MVPVTIHHHAKIVLDLDSPRKFQRFSFYIHAHTHTNTQRRTDNGGSVHRLFAITHAVKKGNTRLRDINNSCISFAHNPEFLCCDNKNH